MRYRLIKPEWAKAPESEGGIPGENSFDGDDLSPEFLAQKNAEGYGIYYFPNHNSKPFDGNYLSGKHVDVFDWVYVDMDLKDKVYADKDEFITKLLEFEILPTKILASGNGVHAYWRVTDLTRERFCELQLRLIKYFKTDRSIWTVLRCMRLEGYYNTKSKDNFKLAEAEVWSEEPYIYHDLVQHLPELDRDEEMKVVNHLRKIDGQEPEIVFDDVDVDTLPEAFIKLLEKSRKINDLFFDEDGDKSKNEWELVNLLYERDFSRSEALVIVANAPKAVSKGEDRLRHAAGTVDKCYREKAKYTVPSAAERMRFKGGEKRRGRLVKGPEYFDCLKKGWRTQQLFTLVGGSGIGKSTLTLDAFRAIIQNNPDSDDICIYFNLEMTDTEIIEKWSALTDNDPKLAERLYVVSNESDDGEARNINLQQIYWFVADITKATGKRVAAIAIDHVGVINPTIDISKKPDFGMAGDMENSFGNLRNISPRKMPQLIKELAKQLDTFIILQSQTTKQKGADGDIPLGIDAAFGTSATEQYSDLLMTIWQPLRRVANKTDLRVLGWQYAKVRFRSKGDPIEPYSPEYMLVDVDTGRLYHPNPDEEAEFEALNKEATLLRKRAEKKDEVTYKASKGGIGKLKSLLAVK